MNASVIMLCANVFLSIIFIKLFGFSGVAWGTMAAVNVGTIYFLWKLHQNLSIPAALYLQATWPFCGLSLFAGACILGIDIFLKRSFLPLNRIIELVLFISTGAVFSLVYLAAVYYARLFDANDADFLKEKFPFIHRILSAVITSHG